MKTNNLTPWQAGVSGNPNGRPKGSRNIKNVIIELLEDPDVYDKLPNKQPDTTKTPIEAIVHTLLSKALDGDVRAADVLLKHAIPRELMPEVEGGFFSRNTELIIRVVEPDGSLRDFYDPNKTIDVEPEPSKDPEPQPQTQPSTIAF